MGWAPGFWRLWLPGEPRTRVGIHPGRLPHHLLQVHPVESLDLVDWTGSKKPGVDVWTLVNQMTRGGIRRP